MRRVILAMGVVAMAGAWAAASGGQMTLVENGVVRAPVVLPENAPESTRRAANELADYVEKISGARPDVVEGVPDPLPDRAVWVGHQPVLNELFPETEFRFEHPEEILFAANENHLVIAGRDILAGEKQIEHGTANAVYTFLDKKLGIVWLWPGPTGEDVPQSDTIAFSPFEYRYHPPLLMRHLWRGMLGMHWEPHVAAWFRYQRLQPLYSRRFSAGHGFTDWWERHHEEHPDWFALRGDGTRTPERWGPDPNPHAVKLCVSNPEVWEQWLDNAEAALRDDPTRFMVSASPNDGGGFCTCENCRAWDHPDAPPGVLTERYVKFWNILARGLKERFPERDVYVGAYAYSAYTEPPIDEDLEDNIVIGYVGHFPLTTGSARSEQMAAWKEWADKATMMWYRPNLFYWSGGVWGMPEVAMQKTAEDFRFLAENSCVGMEVDSLRNCWATQGIQYYVMAQFSYDPFQDVRSILDRYYQRGFGPAAKEIEEYWSLMGGARQAVMDDPEFRPGSGKRYKTPEIFERVYTAELLDQAANLLDQAAAKVVGEREVYAKRVEFVRVGLDFTRLLIENIPLMARLRESGGRDTEAAGRVEENWETIRGLVERTDPIAFSPKNIEIWITGKGYMGGMQDYFGPPSEELMTSAREQEVHLAPAEWKEAWADGFDRAEIGDDWRVLEGQWTMEEGRLVSRGGGKVVATRKFPGLHRVKFQASIAPDPLGIVSDMSPIIQCGPDGSGYLVQFGGYHNTKSSLQKQGKVLVETEKGEIEPDKTHEIVAELDGNRLRLTVDGETIVEQADYRPLVGADHEHIGFYVYRGSVKIDRVTVYTSEATRRDADGDPDVRFAD